MDMDTHSTNISSSCQKCWHIFLVKVVIL